MSSLQLQYGILSSYDNHWFLYRPKNNNTELRISHPLARDSTKPPVLKSYAYLAWIAQQDPISPSHNSNRRQTFALQQGQQNSGSGQLSRSLSNPHHNLRSTSSDRENQDPTEKGFDCSEFKFECSLGNGQTGGTYRCKFYGQTIALKTLDLYKNGRFFDQMKKEIGIYKRLSKIQGKYIPELVCYGYYGGGMGYVMGMTIVGTMLNFHKIAKWQKNQALNALRIIHSHNILHNDIREENILVNDEGNIFFIDFEEFGKRKLSAGYVYDIIGQIYNYMSSLQLQYGILSSYDNHWFLYRPKNNNTELRISHPLARDSTKPPVLKSYAYLAWIAQQDPISPSHNSNRRQTFALQQGQQNSGSGQLSRSLSNPHHNLRTMHFCLKLRFGKKIANITCAILSNSIKQSANVVALDSRVFMELWHSLQDLKLFSIVQHHTKTVDLE
ncbi:kinase-like domain-containing protein [Rhizophagus irregularis DAOM 181602=DAOM 197198]|uniref:Kinase-like domain-containing protein n=1 Tax=Rhizophagus irregularis (strain DAOM 181602 / DAOM 197198 / MUCL 43194) TaxID=747089 RepID=A0A2P4NZX5_RHIID|nr:kinase-like domain-containing protein [Rhizophagus irregularis DAOM 181602=DAOM 197198]POG58673.1 kinase-like domain-containing protein [Rhizophagus irregularis DAOM 181602=DAOM 197198]|eukprot:XP_025165539.1 kinase-like domain-containing protein [Rhizophagus irregularis DAOM 181602=DAOM 197198]